MLLTPLLWLSLAQAQACYETQWFSEEQNQSAFCNTGFAVRAVKCNGPYCDNKSLTCCPYLQGHDRDAKFQWSEWFSEEGSNNDRQRIHPGAFISGLSCNGKYCDKLAINFVFSPHLKNTGSCRYLQPFSEEGLASASCSANEFASGLRCSGAYCDNLELYCCTYSR
ncbi:MAG: hypothetical protein GY807_19550 [Gammaproteobacteria bacterium]|nr:hypothetical protein [Gammaproteobacteria bacterium]